MAVVMYSVVANGIHRCINISVLLFPVTWTLPWTVKSKGCKGSKRTRYVWLYADTKEVVEGS